MTPATPQPDTSVCPRCGAGLRCAMVAGEAECWCAQMPLVMPTPEASVEPTLPDGSAAACFCFECLRKIIDEHHHALSAPHD